MTRIASAIGVPDDTRGSRSPDMHDVADLRQVGAELAARVEGAEMVGREAPRFEERHGERIADHQLQHRRGGRRQAVPAGLRAARQGRASRRPAAQGGAFSPLVMAMIGMVKRRA